jgi:hypothetical protein
MDMEWFMHICWDPSCQLRIVMKAVLNSRLCFDSMAHIKQFAKCPMKNNFS